MKKFTLFAFLFWSAILGYGQLILSSGSQIVVTSGSTVIANDITNSGGSITNNGTLLVKGDLDNNTTGLLASSSSGMFTFNGSSAQEITGDTDAGFYGTLKIDNSSGVSITSTNTGSGQTINSQLVFASGILTLNAFDLTIGATDPTGAGSTKYIKTNGSGGIIRSVPADGSSNVVYAVGNSTYNPLILQNASSGATDNYNVRVVDNEPKNTVSSHMVDRSWVVTENTLNGSKLTATPQWNSGEELTGFDRTNSAVGITIDAGSTYNWKTYGAATGTYTRQGETFTGIGTFAVADKDYVSDNTIVADVNIANSESDCYNAVNVLTVAADETVIIENGGEAIFIAGQTIFLKPGFHAYAGSSTHAYITQSGDYCGSLAPVAPPPASWGGEDITSISDPFENNNISKRIVNVYPNPTKGMLTIDFNGKETTGTVRIVNFHGGIILETETYQQLTKKIDIQFLSEGMYLLVINTEGEQIIKKIIKNY